MNNFFGAKAGAEEGARRYGTLENSDPSIASIYCKNCDMAISESAVSRHKNQGHTVDITRKNSAEEKENIGGNLDEREDEGIAAMHLDNDLRCPICLMKWLTREEGVEHMVEAHHMDARQAELAV